MLCSEVCANLNALIDGELPSEVLVEVRQHLDGCQGCQSELAALRTLDQQLSAGLSLEEVRPQAAKRIEMLRDPTSAPSLVESSNWAAWTIGLLTLAACIVMVFRASIFSTTRPPAVDETQVATLIRATGSVQMQLPESDKWNSISRSTLVSITRGSRIRTQADIRCELQTPENSTIRMDELSELVLHGSERCEVVSGRVWCHVGGSDSLRVEVPVDGNAGEMLAMECPSDSKFQWSVDEHATTCSSEANSVGTISCGPYVCPVDPGATVAIARQIDPRQLENPVKQSKAWQLPLLAITRAEDGEQWREELFATLRPLLAPIGFTKVTHLNEQQILALGPSGAVPLLAYVKDPNSKMDPQLRQTAMRLACKTAGENAVDVLTVLRSDDDPVIKTLAAQTLARLGH